MKSKILLIIVVGIIIIGAVFLFQIINRGTDTDTDRGIEEISKEPSVEIIRAHLFRAGTDYELGRRNEGEEVIEFQKGDYFGISARIEIEEAVVVNTDILDENNIVIEKNPMSPLEKSESGSFGLCCALVPDEEGNYSLRLEINGTEKDIAFTVASSSESEQE